MTTIDLQLAPREVERISELSAQLIVDRLAPLIGPTKPTKERLLKKDQVAELFGISVASVDSYESQGVIPRRLKLGRAVRWRESECLASLDQLPRGVAGRPEEQA